MDAKTQISHILSETVYNVSASTGLSLSEVVTHMNEWTTQLLIRRNPQLAADFTEYVTKLMTLDREPTEAEQAVYGSLLARINGAYKAEISGPTATHEPAQTRPV